MKKIELLAAVLALLAGGIQSCTKGPDPADGREMTVRLNLDGDFDIDLQQDPLTRAGSTNDAYGINVYYDKEGDGIQDDRYAYGVFDNTADMTITLLSNHKYKVVCTLVKDAKNTLYFGQAFGNAYSGYAYPFQTGASGSTLVGNKFIIGTSDILSGMSSGNAHIAATTSPSAGNATPNASVNRFYGETSDYEPVPNGTINVYLKRVVFGAKFVISGVKEGRLKVTCGDFFDKTYSADNEGSPAIYSFTDIYTCWQKETPLTAEISFTYTSNRGTLWDITQSQTIQFRRNVMTTVNVRLTPDLSGGLFELEEEPLDEENIIDMGINTDGLIDIIVNPES